MECHHSTSGESGIKTPDLSGSSLLRDDSLYVLGVLGMLGMLNLLRVPDMLGARGLASYIDSLAGKILNLYCAIFNFEYCSKMTLLPTCELFSFSSPVVLCGKKSLGGSDVYTPAFLFPLHPVLHCLARLARWVCHVICLLCVWCARRSYLACLTSLANLASLASLANLAYSLGMPACLIGHCGNDNSTRETKQ